MFKYTIDEMIEIPNEPGLATKLTCSDIPFVEVSVDIILVPPMKGKFKRFSTCQDCGNQWAIVRADSDASGKILTDGCLNDECENYIGILWEVSR